MALCRFVSLAPGPSRLQAPANPTPLFFVSSYLPFGLHKFTLRHHPKPLTVVPTCTSFALPQSLSMETPPQGYRRNVGICLINTHKKVFAASRLDITSSWQMPQGGIDGDEDPRAAAIRELREETGVSSAEVLAEVPSWLTYDFPPEVREKLNHQWGSDWKGQAQKWFEDSIVHRSLHKVEGIEDVTLQNNKTLDQSITKLFEQANSNLRGFFSSSLGRRKKSICWVMGLRNRNLVNGHGCHQKKLLSLWAVEFKRPVYKQVLEVFGPHLQ